MAALTRHRSRRRDLRPLGGADRQDQDLVCCNATCGPLEPSRQRHTCCDALKRAGQPGIRLHDLRHTAATLLPP